MKWSHVTAFTAEPDKVVERLCDPQFLEAMYAEIGDTDLKILDNTDEGGRRHLKFTRTTSADVPGALRKVLPGTSTVTQVDTWEPGTADGRRGHVKVEIAGAPVKINATLTVTAREGQGSELLVDGEAKSSIPLVGGKLADFVGGQARESMERQMAFGQKWEAEHPA